MSLNPFVADTTIATRQKGLASSIGPTVHGQIATLIAARRRDVAANLGGIVLKAEAEALIAEYGLGGVEDLMLLALPAAQAFAHPPISDFHVGAVGLEVETGNLILGGNIEFPGTHLGFAVHGEGFVFTRAFSRGTTIATIAIGEAHPCAHCRQYLSEFAATRDLMLIDPLGHRLTMAQLFPWPFDPEYLGEAGVVPGKVLWPNLAFDQPVADMPGLLAAGRRAHTPYSKSPSAVALTLTDGGVVAGASIESVAFNPTMGPLQAALIDLRAHGHGYDEIASATLGTVIGGAVDYSRATAELLHGVAPDISLTVAGWKP